MVEVNSDVTYQSMSIIHYTSAIIIEYARIRKMIAYSVCYDSLSTQQVV
jgi:hypothetical protein